MKVTINEDAAVAETEVVIYCKKEDATIKRIVSAIRLADKRMIGSKDGTMHKLDFNDILYFESVNRKTFLYTNNEIYETEMRLYEIEDSLQSHSFFRASKAIIINLCRVQSLRPELGSRLVLTMDNGEKVVVSRQYATSIKVSLGV